MLEADDKDADRARARLRRARRLPPAGRGRALRALDGRAGAVTRARRSTSSSSRRPTPTASARSGSCSRARTRTAPPACAAIKARGGVAIVQDPETAERQSDARRARSRRRAADASCRSSEIAQLPLRALRAESTGLRPTGADFDQASCSSTTGRRTCSRSRRSSSRSGRSSCERIGRGGARGSCSRDDFARDPARRPDAGPGRLRDRRR